MLPESVAPSRSQRNQCRHTAVHSRVQVRLGNGNRYRGTVVISREILRARRCPHGQVIGGPACMWAFLPERSYRNNDQRRITSLEYIHAEAKFRQVPRCGRLDQEVCGCDQVEQRHAARRCRDIEGDAPLVS